ncbi:MAG: hypothetical protein KJO05_02030 [Bacteroidia bacterium]|nr:hypothetical protein [Bacteroidia bacterium]NNF29959.1 hypothetical protein [Flavobacteriaceae bacterium]MBT8276061.1 hypothetical protein [Bacteroidia bacterium]NNJ81211.1 hypothetical protein [Flavobacteriaceae bacterium]NNK53664.1 hypothetical protein [Flavobacteriaceae bacterium]
MRNIFICVVTLIAFGSQLIGQEISPYIKIGETQETIQQASDKIIATLKDNSFAILGAYHPSNKSNLKVITFTRSDLKYTVIKVKDRGALAAIYKIGLIKDGDKVIMSYTNPEYILRAYLGDHYNRYKSTFVKFSSDLEAALSNVGTEFKPFGGTVAADKLKKYHYKIMMPYFTDPVELREFASFEEGLATIESNLKAKKGNTKMVYKLVYKSSEVAVFGVGLQSREDGEPHFLPKIGEAHVAALPYEIILQGNKATILHGKYRIALHWPDLSMGTFMKIMSTPGDIEDTMEALCQ